jgi:autotransporter translocation and assembly factor TamB
MKVRRVLIWLGASIVALLLAATVVLYWASRSETVLRWAIDRFAPSLPCTLTVEGLEGGIMKPVRVQYLACENADFYFEARTIALVWSASPLAARRLDISSLSIEALHFTSRIDPVQAAPSPPLEAPQQLELPIAINVDSVEIATLVTKRGERSIELRAIDAAYRADKDSHRLTLRNLEHKWGRVTGEALVGTTAPLPLTAKFSVVTEHVEGTPLTADVALTGQLQNVSASINAYIGEQQRASATLVLAPFDPQPVKSLTAQASGVDVATFDKRLPHTGLAVTLQAKSPGESTLTGQVRAENAIMGQLDQQRLPLQSLDTHFDLDASSLRLSNLKLDLGAAGSAHGVARLARDQINLQVEVSNLDLRAVRGNLRETRLNGNLAAEHRGDVQLVTFDLAQKDLQFEGKAEIGERRVLIERLIARAGAAQLRASATLDRDERLGFSVALWRFCTVRCQRPPASARKSAPRMARRGEL